MHYHISCNNTRFGVNYTDAITEFTKRLSPYCTITLHLQSSLILPKDITVSNHQFILLLPGFSTHSSEDFAQSIKNLQQSGKSNIHVLIGFSEEECYTALSKLPDYIEPLRISLSSCTLPTDTLTLLFYEQLYRGYTILQGKTYHK